MQCCRAFVSYFVALCVPAVRADVSMISPSVEIVPCTAALRALHGASRNANAAAKLLGDYWQVGLWHLAASEPA